MFKKILITVGIAGSIGILFLGLSNAALQTRAARQFRKARDGSLLKVQRILAIEGDSAGVPRILIVAPVKIMILG